VNPLDSDDEAVEDNLPLLVPEAMNPEELADAVEQVARSARQRLTPAQVETLMLAARRVRQVARMRETLLARLEMVERLEHDLARVRNGELDSPGTPPRQQQ
jgi:hypothetical protein